MDRETLSHYGWIVILVLILAVMLALATPFGNFLAEGFKATYAGFGMTSDNALGIVIPGAETHEPNTIYYYQPYRAAVDGGVVELVFHKDGAVDLYLTPPAEYGGPYGDIAPSGTAVYGEGTVEFDGMSFTINEDGTAITAEDGGTPLTFTLIPTPIHPLYMNTEYGAKDGDDWKYTLKFQADGSCTYKEYYQGVEDYKEDYQAGTLEYFDEYFTNSWYNDYEDKTYVYRNAVYPNGLKIICDGSIYEIDCQHLNTEIRNKTDNYTGDTHCKDCGILIEKGIYLTGQTYALYFEGNKMLVFTRSEEEIVAGDTYDGMVISEVYTGFETDRYQLILNPKSREAAPDPVSTVPWYSHAGEITNVRFDCVVKPISTSLWFYNFKSYSSFDLTNLDMTNVDDTSYMFANSVLTSIPKMNSLGNVKNMSYMFAKCYSLSNLNGFNITNGVTNIDNIFEGCAGISNFSSLSIPSSVITMNYAFYDCENMIDVPNMNNATKVQEMDLSFAGCKKIISAPNIPTSVIYMSGTFEGCTALKNVQNLTAHTNLKVVNDLFANCSSLEKAPVLPNGVEYANGTFAYCENLKTYYGNTDGNGNFKNYIIPSSIIQTGDFFNSCKLIHTVSDLDHCTSLEWTYGMYSKCTALINAPKLPSSVVTIGSMFSDCTSLITAPDLSNCTKVRNMEYIFHNCKNLKSAPIIPYGTTTIRDAFSGSGINTYHGNTDGIGDFSNYTIPNTVTNMKSTFSSCTLLVKGPTIPSSVTELNSTFSYCTSLEYIKINANPTQYSFCFGLLYTQHAPDLILDGASTMLETLARTQNQGYRDIFDINGNELTSY